MRNFLVRKTLAGRGRVGLRPGAFFYSGLGWPSKNERLLIGFILVNLLGFLLDLIRFPIFLENSYESFSVGFYSE